MDFIPDCTVFTEILLFLNTFVLMDDLQFWLYVIIGVIYLITQVRKKSKQQQNIPPSKPAQESTTADWQMESRQSTPEKKPMTFEELLREITEAKESTTQYETTEQPEYVDYDDNIPDEIQEVELVDYTKTDPIYQQYEDAKSRDYSTYSLEDNSKMESSEMRFGKFREFESESRANLLDLYLKDLRDPEGMKKAVVLSEVLSPKYF